MAYINNYREPVELAQGATTAALSLPDGEYRLTLTNKAGTAWEIVDAVVVSGTATLTRAVESTADQSWPSGSFIYCAVTAGQLNALMAQIADLRARIETLEQGGSVPDGAFVDGAGNALTDSNGNYLTGA